MNSFSLSSDVTNTIKAGHPYGGITFIWKGNFGFNIQVKRYEFDSNLGHGVIKNGSPILFGGPQCVVGLVINFLLTTRKNAVSVEFPQKCEILKTLKVCSYLVLY